MLEAMLILAKAIVLGMMLASNAAVAMVYNCGGRRV